jgi:serine protease AprX
MGCSKSFALIIFSFVFGTVSAQSNRYMVFFKDKTGSPYSVNAPSQFLSPRAIERRIKSGVDVVSEDLPVNQSYVNAVKGTGAEVYFKTRWMNGVLVQCPASLIASIQALSFVDHVELVAPQAKLTSGGRNKITLRKKNHVGLETSTQLDMLGVPQMHHDGYRGENMWIAVFDGGFLGVNTTAPFQNIFSEGRFNDSLSHNFIVNSKNVFQYDDHGTMVLSTIGAEVPDLFTGGAYKANFSLFVTEDVGSELRIEEYNWLFAAERADSAGVDIISSSLGYNDFDGTNMDYTLQQMDGSTAVSTRAAQMAADRGVLVVCSAGNEGNDPSWGIITAPADAVDVIAVANVNSNGQRSSSSSIGPSADGRTKPDLAALGSGVKVIRANGLISSASGTSLSCPLITALAAGVWQRYSTLTNKELIELLKRTASRANFPNNEIGYGIPNYTGVVNYFDTSLTQSSVFAVFPTQIVDTVKVRPIDPDQYPTCRLELITSDGRIIANQVVDFNWVDREYESNMSAFAPGIYYFRIWVGDKRFVFKVFKV